MLKGTIIYIGGFELPDKNAAAHRVLSNSKAFKELGYNVVLIDLDKSLSYESNVLSTYKMIQGFECWSLPYPKSMRDWINYLSNITSVKTIIEKYKNVKIVILYNYSALPIYKLKIYCTSNFIKIVSDCTEWYSTNGTNLVYKIIKGVDSLFRMRVINKQLDGLIVISKYLENYYKESNNVIRIPPLVDKSEKKWLKIKNIIAETSVIDKKIQLVYSGSPGRNKDNISYIIDALCELREFENYHLIIVGVSEDQFKKYYPNYINKLIFLNEKVDFVERVTHEESLEILGKANFSIFFRDVSRHTMAGFPTKLVESMSLGIPVITNDTSDICEYIRDNENGYIVSNFGVREIASKLRFLFSQTHEELNKTKNKIRAEEFDYRNFMSELGVFLHNILS